MTAQRVADLNSLRLAAGMAARAASHVEDLARQFHAPAEVIDKADAAARLAWKAENAAHDAYIDATKIQGIQWWAVQPQAVGK